MYISPQYETQIKKADSATRERYELIRRLSDGFTKSNDTALELDALLVEWLKKNKPKPKREKPKSNTVVPGQVERISDEVRFIKRYALLHQKVKTPDQMRSFLNSLQKAILEKRIRKTSAYAREIKYIQEALINFLRQIKKPALVKVDEKVLERFQKIAASEKQRLSVNYLKRYIGIQGKHLDKEKAIRLHSLIDGAIKKERITGDDPYNTRVKNAKKALETFISSADKNDTLQVHETVLNGIKQALDGCPCEERKEKKKEKQPKEELLSGVNDSPVIMNSMDFVKMSFNTLGFKGKWLDLIGDPAPGFTAMVYGKPKLGKSYLCIDLAGYLAHNFGRVLYVAKEEGLDATLQQKLNDKQVAHPRLDVARSLPEDISQYDFIFFDSVTRLGLAPEDLEAIKEQHPEKSFIYIFQTIKDGNFRGSQEFQHDVDIVIEVYELGKARQFGRFNQGGEMSIFE